MKKKKLMDYYDDFVKSGKLREKASREGDFKTSNKQYHYLKKIFDIAKNDLESASPFYKRLMDEDNLQVKISASAHSLALNINIEKAEKTLNEIASNKNRDVISGNAEMTLKQWKKNGYLIV